MSNPPATAQQSPHRAVLWFGVLAPPLVWAAGLFGGWAMGEIFACGPANSHTGFILGFTVNAFAAIVNGALLVVSAMAGLLAFTKWRSLRNAAAPNGAGTDRWLAFAGFISGAVFTGGILLSYLPIVLVPRCR
jgi:hypothetical protein